MKKTQKIVLGLGILALFALGGLSHAEAYRGDPNIKGPNYTVERHENMTKAFENKDYSSWKSLMEGRGRVTEIINEKNFGQFVSAHNLALKGDLTAAQKIREELGLGLGLGNRMGNRGGMFRNR